MMMMPLSTISVLINRREKDEMGLLIGWFTLLSDILCYASSSINSTPSRGGVRGTVW